MDEQKLLTLFSLPAHQFLDTGSSALQARSTVAILRDFVGERLRPLLVLDSGRSVQRPREVSARIAAAMSLRPLASDLRFLLRDAENPDSVDWDSVLAAAEGNDALLVYGFTWMLWLAWGQAQSMRRPAKSSATCGAGLWMPNLAGCWTVSTRCPA